MIMKTMKTAAALTVFLASGALATPNHMLVYLPSQTDGQSAKAVYEGVIDILSEMAPQTRLEVLSNPNLSQVFEIETPADMPKHPDWRRSFFQQPIGALQAYVRGAYKAGQAATVKPINQVGLHDIIAALPRRAVEKPEVVIFGSPRDNVENDPANNTLTRFPNDAFLDLPIQVSRFGTAGQKDSLNGVRVHVCLLDNGYVDTKHPGMLERFTSLRLEEMGGTLATWTNDTKECLRRALAERTDGIRAFERSHDADTPAYYDIRHAVLTPKTTSASQLALLDEMPVTPAAKVDLTQHLRSGDLKLVAVKVYDTDAEDGDAVTIIANNVSYDVFLTNARQTVTLPVLNGKVTLVGLKDGKGGITVGIETTDGNQSMTPVMRVGEKIEIPFYTK
ncbi:MAG: hypothetical protein ABJO27_07340 [Pseudoruegeria sp.]